MVLWLKRSSPGTEIVGSNPGHSKVVDFIGIFLLFCFNFFHGSIQLFEYKIFEGPRKGPVCMPSSLRIENVVTDRYTVCVPILLYFLKMSYLKSMQINKEVTNEDRLYSINSRRYKDKYRSEKQDP